MNFKNLGKYLRIKRDESELTQQGLAQKLGGMNTQFVSNWERGLCAPPSHAFESVIRILKLDRKIIVDEMMKDSKIQIEAAVYKKKGRKLAK